MLLLMALFAPLAANAQVQIGSGETTNSYLPSYSYYNYSISQQIYTADEIAASGNITSIAFYNGGTVKARKYDIYMAHTTKTAFDDTSDWIALTDADIVYHGTATVSMTANAWTTFTLDTPFAYNGTSNLVICVIDRTGSYSSGMACRVFSTTEYQALYCYNDNYDALSPDGTNDGTALSYTLGRPLLKNQIVLGGIQQAYPTPMDLACTGVTANSATLSWTEIGTATSWQICLDNDETNPIAAATNPFTLTGLTEEQTYTAKVRSCYDGDHYSSWSDATSFTPTAKIVIGSGTSTNSYLPTYIYYLNSLTQQIYTAAELGEGGIITSIDFYCTADNTYSRDFDIYMVSTSKSSFESATDWITVTEGDLVYSGTVTLAAGWNTFELDGFEYDGTSNVAIMVDAHATDYQNGVGFYVYDAPSANQAIYVYSDGTNYDPFNPTTATNTLSVKNQLRLVKEPLPPCSKPTGFAVTEVTNHTATLSWTSDASAWQLCINGDEANPIPVTTNPYTMTGLDAETTYTVKLRANCGAQDGVSFWTGEQSFTTEIACPAPTALSATTTPNSATMTWNGSANEYEMEYAVLGDGVTGIITYTFEEDLEDWTNLIVNEDQGEWLHSSENQGGYDYTELAHGGTGFAMCYSFVDYVGSYETDAYLVSPSAYQINAGASLNFWYDMANDNYPEYFEVCVATVAAPTAEDFTPIWSWSEDKSMGDPARKVPMSRSDKRHINRTRSDNWREVTVDLSAYEGQSIWIAFHDENSDMYEVWIDDVTVDAGTSGDITWIPVGTVTSPYTLEGLDPETFYMVHVRAVCGGIDGESAWTTTTFTTPSMCDAPFALNVPTETLMPTTATLEWTGYQDGFEVRYRPTVSYDPIYEEGFENGIPSDWTLINNDTTSLNDWFALSDIMDIYSYYTSIPDWAHSGSNAALSSSYANGVGAFATDQYLVSPQLDLQGTLRFFAASTYYDEFEVLLSTTTNEMSAFTTTLRPMTAVSTNSGWDEISIDMSAYAGQQGYIAIHHVFEDGYFLIIDDFGLYNVVESDWIPVSTDAQFVDIEDLDPETDYEWQVRGEYRNCTNGEEEGYTPWSTMGTFTTPGLCDQITSISIDSLAATFVTLSWTGYQETYDVRYRIAASADEVFYDDFTEYDDIDGDDYITLADTDWTGSNLNDDEEQPSTIYTLNFEDGSSMAVFGFAGNGTDQYLISPEFEIENAGILEFFYYAYNGSTQTFQVGYSSTDNELSSFTWGESFTNGSEDYLDYYDAELPAGTKYFAIKSSGESSLLLLGEFYVGDNYVPDGEWIEANEVTSPYTITGLTPETTYQVQLHGICGDHEYTDWVGGYITTPEQTTLTQTVALAEGVNWFSTYLEITLEDLEAALETAGSGIGTIIKGKTQSITLRNNGWKGTLRSLDVAQMYRITTTTECEIVLEGMLIDPAEHPVTIAANAVNWIGYQLSESMKPADLFAGFNAVNGDVIKSKTGGTAQYRSNRWMPNSYTLTPGLGYTYTSASSESRVFTFPTSAKSASKTNNELKKEGGINQHKTAKSSVAPKLNVLKRIEK